MSKYMIHICNKRLWYVHGHLVPSLISQGIDQDDIILYRDINNDGCLKSSINSFKLAAEQEFDGMWHLQDDVLICSDFKKRTEENDDGIVCGFASSYDKNPIKGKVTGVDNMWFSFPCIRIPTSILKHYTIWCDSYIINDNRYKNWIESNKNDDLLFRYFLKSYYKDVEALNLAPNLVEHVDWLIGGSMINNDRDRIIRSLYWKENNLVDELSSQLKYRSL